MHVPIDGVGCGATASLAHKPPRDGPRAGGAQGAAGGCQLVARRGSVVSGKLRQSLTVVAVVVIAVVVAIAAEHVVVHVAGVGVVVIVASLGLI